MLDRTKRVELVENFMINFKENEVLNECLQYKGYVGFCKFIGQLTGNTYIKIGIDTNIEIKSELLESKHIFGNKWFNQPGTYEITEGRLTELLNFVKPILNVCDEIISKYQSEDTFMNGEYTLFCETSCIKLVHKNDIQHSNYSLCFYKDNCVDSSYHSPLLFSDMKSKNKLNNKQIEKILEWLDRNNDKYNKSVYIVNLIKSKYNDGDLFGHEEFKLKFTRDCIYVQTPIDYGNEYSFSCCFDYQNQCYSSYDDSMFTKKFNWMPSLQNKKLTMNKQQIDEVMKWLNMNSQHKQIDEGIIKKQDSYIESLKKEIETYHCRCDRQSREISQLSEQIEELNKKINNHKEQSKTREVIVSIDKDISYEEVDKADVISWASDSSMDSLDTKIVPHIGIISKAGIIFPLMFGIIALTALSMILFIPIITNNEYWRISALLGGSIVINLFFGYFVWSEVNGSNQKRRKQKKEEKEYQQMLKETEEMKKLVTKLDNDIQMKVLELGSLEYKRDKLKQVCPGCGRVVDDGIKFCPNCGTFVCRYL